MKKSKTVEIDTDDDNDFDIMSYFIADSFELHVYQWYKNECLVGNATLLLAEKWGNRRLYVKKNFDELNEIGKMIREGRKQDALSWIENVLSEEAKELVTAEVYEHLQG
jgi:hypothetical protein